MWMMNHYSKKWLLLSAAACVVCSSVWCSAAVEGAGTDDTGMGPIDPSASLGQLQALLPALGEPALTPTQYFQLMEANDLNEALDTPAWYALLENAKTWTRENLSGATEPDFQKIAKAPARYRGRLFEFTGRLVTAQDDRTIARRDDFPDLERWVILPQIETGDVHTVNASTVVVYLTDPPQSVREGQWVTVAGRFYKYWKDVSVRDDNEPTYYLVFVGHSTVAGAPPPPAGFSFSGLRPTHVVILVVFIVGVVGLLIFLGLRVRKLSFTPKPLGPRRAARRGAVDWEDDEEEDPWNESTTPLPEDPDEALLELERRRAAEESDGGEEERHEDT